MANPFPVLTVKIKTYDPSKLSGQLIPDSNRENIINQLKSATVWLPDWAYPLKDGDEVTVVGRQAFNLYQLLGQLNSGSTSTFEALYFGEQPDVLNFVLTTDGLMTSFSWTSNSIYKTYAEYKVDDGNWTVIGSFDKGASSSTFDFTGIAELGQTAYIRLRFGNGTDFFSSWTAQSVVLAIPFVLFYGNTLPDLNNFIAGIGYSSEPTLSLSGNNVIIDHPEYVTQFGYLLQPFDGQFNFTDCSNIDDIQIGVNGGADVSGCGNLISFSMNGNTGEFDIDFTGCTSLIYIIIYNSNITNTDFLDTLPDKSLVSSIAFFDNNITTVDFTDFTNIYVLDISSNANLSSLILNSSTLTEIYASNTVLTSLDLSSSLTYNIINIGSSNISTLTIANGTANEGETKSYYDISNNDLSIASLNAFFTALGSGNTFKKNKKQVAPFINVQGNPGAQLCDPTIATAKGWSVYTGYPLGTGISLTQEGSTLVFDFAWTQNANYSTYSQYKINSGGAWTNIDTYAPNYMPVEVFDASSYMTVGDTFYLRLRFGDDVDYGSWDESSITTA